MLHPNPDVVIEAWLVHDSKGTPTVTWHGELSLFYDK